MQEAFSICYLLAFLTEIPVLQNVILYVFFIQWILFIPAYLFKTEKFYDLAGSSTYIFAVSYILGSGGNIASSENYNITYSLIEQPVENKSSANYNLELGWSYYFE